MMGAYTIDCTRDLIQEAQAEENIASYIHLRIISLLLRVNSSFFGFRPVIWDTSIYSDIDDLLAGSSPLAEYPAV